jgi:hypothetical protein
MLSTPQYRDVYYWSQKSKNLASLKEGTPSTTMAAMDEAESHTDAISTSGGDDVERMLSGNFTDEELGSFTRPKNMFDVTDMTYEEYVEKHYEIMGKKHSEQMLAQQMAMMQQMMRQQAAGGFGAGMGGGMGGGGYGPPNGGAGVGYGRPQGGMPNRPPPGYCNAFQVGSCKFGDNCRYKHEIPEPGAGAAAPIGGGFGQAGGAGGGFGQPGGMGGMGGGMPARDPNRPVGYCNAFQKGECKFGDSCRYRHEINPRPFNPDFQKNRPMGMTNMNAAPTNGGSTGAFAAAGYGGF